MRKVFQWRRFKRYNNRRKRNRRGNIGLESTSPSKNQLNEIIVRILKPYLEKIKSEGLRNRISRFIFNNNIDRLIIEQVKKRLSSKKVIHLGKGLGLVDVQYQRNGIQLDFCGFSRLIFKRITIADSQILHIADSIISQAEEKYIKNPDYIIERIKKILDRLSGTEIYKPSTNEEKTMYDLALLIILNYYKNEEERPGWVKSAIENLKKGDFIEDWIETILEHIYSVVSNISENLYVDLGITFDSLILRAIFNKKTNNGQISKFLSLMGIDIKKLIYSIAYDYLSPSFIEGAGELLKDIAESFLFDFWKSNSEYYSKISSKKSSTGGIYCLTMTFGEDPNTERLFRWFTDKKLNLSLKFSKSENFNEYNLTEAECKCVPFSYPVINLGVVTSYKIRKNFKYSAKISNLELNTLYYYKIIDNEGNEISEIHKFYVKSVSEELEFLVLADSQGMVERDYDIFLKVFEESINKFPKAGFVVHMGDFVDDGNNEVYWRWVLNSKLWAENVVMPVSGNHESKLNSSAGRVGVENSILRHFNFKPLPEQSVYTGAYYSCTLGQVLFIVLNTNNMDGYSRLNQEQYSWALNTAKNSTAKWKIILTHKSPYSNGPHHRERDTKEIGKQVINLAYEAEIDLVIGGHDHVYTRTPTMAWGKCISQPNLKIRENGVDYDLFSNPFGTIFIVPGTSGVKNYKVDKNTAFPTEKIINLNCPVYSRVKITKNRIYFTSYKYSVLKGKSEHIDGIIIEKKPKIEENLSSFTAIDSINCISNVPWAPSEKKIERAAKIFKGLNYYGKLCVYNYKKLNRVQKLNVNYKEIIQKDIEIVKNKIEFLEALRNKKVSTIITDCTEIKFENCLGLGSKVIIDKNLCIRGSARLLFVSFVLEKGAMLVLGGSVCIDNSRRPFSMYSSLNAIEVRDNSCFIMLDYSSIRAIGGIGFRNHGVYLSGKEAMAFLNTKSENFAEREFVFAPNNSSKIFIGEGSYFSLGSKHAVLSAGKVEIVGGKIGGIKLLPKAEAKMYGGTINSRRKKPNFTPLYCQGKVEIYGGSVNSLQKKAIKVIGLSSSVCFSPDHKGSIKINGKDIFIGEIIQMDSEQIKLKLYKKNEYKKYQSVGLYSYYKHHLQKVNSGLKPEKIEIRNGDVFKFQEKYKNLVIVAKAYKSIADLGIIIKNEGKISLFSKAYLINKNIINKNIKIDEKARGKKSKQNRSGR